MDTHSITMPEDINIWGTVAGKQTSLPRFLGFHIKCPSAPLHNLRKPDKLLWYLLEVLVIQAFCQPLTESQLHFVQTQLEEIVDQGNLESARHKT